ncbi:MAG: hypothetical protein WC482_03885 [Candidatus Omnitrophota bacterium]|jgi:hypothetical protein|nr:hypothetical protein [Candidatus Omnitrophota bacterium]
MIPVCPECSKFGEVTKLYLEETKLVCKACGFIYPGEFKEESGMVLSKGEIELTPEPDSIMYVKLVDMNDPSRQRCEVIETLPLVPFLNGKAVRSYKIKALYELEVYYE